MTYYYVTYLKEVLGVEHPGHTVIFRKNLRNIAHLHDINHNTPGNHPDGFLVFPTPSMGKRLTSCYRPPAHPGLVLDVQWTKVAYYPEFIGGTINIESTRQW